MPRMRIVHVKEGGPVYRVLRATLTTTTDRRRAQRSRFMWGLESANGEPFYRLTPLGVLHAVTGLTLCTSPKNDGHPHPGEEAQR